MQNVNRIITAKDYSLRWGADGTVRGFIRRWQEKLHKEKNVAVTVRGLDAEPQGEPVQAFIHQGQWLAACECGGHEFVNPQEPVFFCWGCTNRRHNNTLRPVEFPVRWAEIEQAVLARPVNDVRGATDLERAGLAQPLVVVVTDAGEFPLVRSWKPEESLQELLDQNAVLNGLEPSQTEAGGVIFVNQREVKDGV